MNGNAAAFVVRWNARYPVGTPVAVIRSTGPQMTVTTHPAFLHDIQTPAIFLDGIEGFYSFFVEGDDGEDRQIIHPVRSIRWKEINPRIGPIYYDGYAQKIRLFRISMSMTRGKDHELRSHLPGAPNDGECGDGTVAALMGRAEAALTVWLTAAGLKRDLEMLLPAVADAIRAMNGQEEA